MGGRAGHVRVCRRLVGVAMFGRGGSRCVAARPFSGRPTGGVSLLLARTRDEVRGGHPPGEGARGEGGRAGTSAGERVSGVRGGGLTGRPRRITLLRRAALLRPSVRRGVIGPDEVQVRGGRPPGEEARVDSGRAGTSAGERVSAAEKREGWGG